MGNVVKVRFTVLGTNMDMEVSADGHYAEDPKVIRESVEESVLEHIIGDMKVTNMTDVVAAIRAAHKD